jgi:hypothetical protein
MKFFTREWWGGIQAGDFSADPAESYSAHLAVIRDRLPTDLLALQESVSLHDGRLREVEHRPSAGTLRMLIDGDDGQGGRRRFTLLYRAVSLFRSVAEPDEGLPGPLGYGDLGYDEADLTDTGEIVHRILFSSGIEFEVRFTDFELTWQDIG